MTYNKKVFSKIILPYIEHPKKKNNANLVCCGKGKLDERFKKKGVRLFNNVHVSGHAGREDLRDFINMINPEHIIPAHGEHEKIKPMVELAQELGYKNKKNVILIIIINIPSFLFSILTPCYNFHKRFYDFCFVFFSY